MIRRAIHRFLANPIVEVVICGGLLLAPLQAMADDDCEEAVSHYNSKLSAVDSDLRRYASCFGASRGREDCSSEFSSLRSSQGDFETAVSRYKQECDQ